MTNIDQTTDQIRATLGVSLTVGEVKNLLIETQAKLRAQRPYLDSRLLFRQERLRLALKEGGPADER